MKEVREEATDCEIRACNVWLLEEKGIEKNATQVYLKAKIEY